MEIDMTTHVKEGQSAETHNKQLHERDTTVKRVTRQTPPVCSEGVQNTPTFQFNDKALPAATAPPLTHNPRIKQNTEELLGSCRGRPAQTPRVIDRGRR